MVQYPKINPCDTPHSQLKNKNHVDAKKAFDKIQHTFIIFKKPSQQIGYSKNIPQHNKGYT